MKDRHATTRQWVSLPAVDAGGGAGGGGGHRRAAGAGGAAGTATSCGRGTCEGNRFEVVLTEVAPGEAAAARRARLAALGRDGLAQPVRRAALRRGGGQRRRGRWRILRGQRRERDWRSGSSCCRRCSRRCSTGRWSCGPRPGACCGCAPGDVLQKTGVGRAVRHRRPGASTSRGWTPASWSPPGRCRATGRWSRPRAREARALEDEALAAVGVTRDELARAGAGPARRAPPGGGGRWTLGDPPVERRGRGRLRLRFALPPGSYATVVLQALAAGRRLDAGRGCRGQPVLTFPRTSHLPPPAGPPCASPNGCLPSPCSGRSGCCGC